MAAGDDDVQMLKLELERIRGQITGLTIMLFYQGQ